MLNQAVHGTERSFHRDSGQEGVGLVQRELDNPHCIGQSDCRQFFKNVRPRITSASVSGFYRAIDIDARAAPKEADAAN